MLKATLIKGTELLIVFQFVGEHGSGQKIYFFNMMDVAVQSSYIILSSFSSRIFVAVKT
jgi:hypothetical protein